MFSRASFSQTSFNPISWRFPDEASPEFARSYAIGSVREREQIIRRRPVVDHSAEEDLLIAAIMAMYATGFFEG